MEKARNKSKKQPNIRFIPIVVSKEESDAKWARVQMLLTQMYARAAFKTSFMVAKPTENGSTSTSRPGLSVGAPNGEDIDFTEKVETEKSKK